MFVWLMITLLAGFGGIIIAVALTDTKKTNSPVGEYRTKGVNL